MADTINGRQREADREGEFRLWSFTHNVLWRSRGEPHWLSPQSHVAVVRCERQRAPHHWRVKTTDPSVDCDRLDRSVVINMGERTPGARDVEMADNESIIPDLIPHDERERAREPFCRLC